MAAKKTKSRSKPAAKKAAARSRSTAKKTKTAPKSGKTVDDEATQAAPAASGQGVKGLRVRMFRVGFGDFFLLTVPSSAGDQHILIDCGVHAKDLGSIQAAVAQMAKDCGSKLALVIMTHRHADHISGFGKCSEVFKDFTVERVWMPWFEDPDNKNAAAFQSNLTALASRLSLKLAARADAASSQFANMVENVTGGMAAAGVSANQKALDVLHKGFKSGPAKPDYYQAGDTAVLPQSLIDAGLSAKILGPPIDPNLIKVMTNTSQQYLTDGDQPDDTPVMPFSGAFCVDASAAKSAYPQEAFEIFSAAAIMKMIDDVQPDVLAAQAIAADNTLNNQSLVILFSFAGKNLLFAGDAQWGNWENFLYGGAYGTPGHTEMTEDAKKILGQLDFYKVGHHGSRNATPKDAVTAMRMGCVGMCSTQTHAYNEVPREPLLQALSARMQGQLARSDQVAATADEQANPDAGPVPTDFTAPPDKTLFIDYDF
jgi:beta-lactamase superfamily II metal-dependent hydrolase